MSATSSQSHARRRVLVVDNHPDIVFLLKLLLETEGFEVRGAVGGRDALRLAAEDDGEKFDAVILDVNMPDVDGVEVARTLRRTEPNRSARIVFHSALGEEQVKARFLDYDAFVSKPADASIVAHRLEQLLASPRSGSSPP